MKFNGMVLGMGEPLRSCRLASESMWRHWALGLVQVGGNKPTIWNG